MKVMSGLDSRFLATETLNAHMHTIKIVILDVGGRQDPLTPERLPALLADRLRRMPVLRRRVVPVPFQLGNPVMIDDPDFDLSRHLRVRTAAPPGGSRQLDEAVAEIAGVALPRDRPLWELTVVEGLQDDRVAFVMKLHHCLADGVAAVALLENAFVVDDHDAVTEEFRPEPVPTGRDLHRSALVSARTAVAAVPDVVGQTVSGVWRARQARRKEATAVPGPFAGPSTSLNCALTPDRTFATLTLPMPALMEVKRAAGVTLNDVFLTLCGGGVRRHLQRRGDLPARTLVASVPVATGTDQQRLEGNHVDNLFLPLGTDLADPSRRVRVIHDASTAARRIRRALGPGLFEARADLIPSGLQHLAARMWSASRLADRTRPPLNLVASCVRGPRTPLALDGGVVTSLYSSGPILEGIGLNVTAWTYVDSMYLSILGCSASLPDPWQFADDIAAELQRWSSLPNVTTPGDPNR